MDDDGLPQPEQSSLGNPPEEGENMRNITLHRLTSMPILGDGFHDSNLASLLYMPKGNDDLAVKCIQMSKPMTRFALRVQMCYCLSESFKPFNPVHHLCTCCQAPLQTLQMVIVQSSAQWSKPHLLWQAIFTCLWILVIMLL